MFFLLMFIHLHSTSENGGDVKHVTIVTGRQSNVHRAGVWGGHMGASVLMHTGVEKELWLKTFLADRVTQ